MKRRLLLFVIGFIIFPSFAFAMEVDLECTPINDSNVIALNIGDSATCKVYASSDTNFEGFIATINYESSYFDISDEVAKKGFEYIGVDINYPIVDPNLTGRVEVMDFKITAKSVTDAIDSSISVTGTSNSVSLNLHINYEKRLNRYKIFISTVGNLLLSKL